MIELPKLMYSTGVAGPPTKLSNNFDNGTGREADTAAEQFGDVMIQSKNILVESWACVLFAMLIGTSHL